MKTTKAFSLIELLMVMSVGLMLMLMAVPAFGQLARKSKVQQTAATLINVFNLANQISGRLCKPEAVVTYIGDDFSSVATKPYKYISAQLPGVLPRYGNIEIWTAKMSGSVINGEIAPYQPPPAYWAGPAYAPFYTPMEPMTVEPFTFHDGVRILAGYCARAGAGTALSPYTYSYVFRYFDRTTDVGEIKRHTIATVNGKGMNLGIYSYTDVLVFDVLTGEHVVINAAGGFFDAADSSGTGGSTANYSAMDYKARIMTDRTTHENIQLSSIVKPSTAYNVYGAPISVVDKKKIPSVIDN